MTVFQDFMEAIKPDLLCYYINMFWLAEKCSRSWVFKSLKPTVHNRPNTLKQWNIIQGFKSSGSANRSFMFLVGQRVGPWELLSGGWRKNEILLSQVNHSRKMGNKEKMHKAVIKYYIRSKHSRNKALYRTWKAFQKLKRVFSSYQLVCRKSSLIAWNFHCFCFMAKYQNCHCNSKTARLRVRCY